jgi:hypothetical protein
MGFFVIEIEIMGGLDDEKLDHCGQDHRGRYYGFCCHNCLGDVVKTYFGWLCIGKAKRKKKMQKCRLE